MISSCCAVFDVFFSQEDDLSRTIGINTEYLGTLDFDMAQADKHYLVEVKMPLIREVVDFRI